MMSIKILSLVFTCLILANANGADIEPKQEIEKVRSQIESSPLEQQGQLLKELALLYLKDQDHEHAFQAFLEALDHTKPLPCVDSFEDEGLYQQALTIYLDQSGSPQAISEKMIKDFSLKLKERPQAHLLSYLVALAYANLWQYEEFFNLFYHAYPCYPDHFLVFKTKAILHIKLMERKRTEAERQEQRDGIIHNLDLALAREPHDPAIYRLLITFSLNEAKAVQVRRCLIKIIDENIMIPRGEVMFFVREAVNAQENSLAKRFIEKARMWYPQSRIVSAAQNFLDAHK